jgi:hypothetical protein
LGLAKHVQRDPTADRRLSAHSIHRLLHLAMPAVAPFHRIGRRTEQAIIQEGQRLLQVRGPELPEDRPQPRAAADLDPQPGQLRQGRLGATPAVEQAVDLLHDAPEGAQSRQSPGHAPQRPLLRRCEVALDEEMTMLEQVPDFPIEVPPPPDLPFRFRRDGTPAGELRLLRRQALAGLSDGTEDCLVQFREDVEPANLMFGGAEDLGNRLRIQLRAVGGDPAKGQPAAGQGRPEAAEESPDIPPSRVVVEDLVAQPLEGAVIDDGQDAEGPVVEFISGDVPGEAVEGPIEVIVPDAMGRLFPPWPPPSSG